MIRTIVALSAVIALAACSDSSQMDPDDDAVPSVPAGEEAIDGEEDGAVDSLVINRASYADIVARVFDVYTGQAYAPDVITLPRYSDPVYRNDLQLTEAQDSVVCSNGGSAEVAIQSAGQRLIVKSTNFVFDNCQDGSTLVDGDLHRVLGDVLRLVSNGISVDEPSVTTTFAGITILSQGNEYGLGPDRLAWSASGVMYTRDTADTMLSIDDAVTLFQRVVPFSATLYGSFSLRDEALGDHRLDVVTTQDFVFDSGGVDGPAWDRRNDWTFDTGRLTVYADDGSSLVLDADTGDAQTVRVSLVNKEEHYEFLEPWSTWSARLSEENWLHTGFHVYQQ